MKNWLLDFEDACEVLVDTRYIANFHFLPESLLQLYQSDEWPLHYLPYVLGWK